SGIVNYHSPLDLGLLGAGTTVFGTTEGKHEPAAGVNGFREPPTASREAYRRLEQVEWRPEMLKEGHVGDHFGWTNRGVVARHIAPRIREARQPTQGSRVSARGD